MNTRPDDAVDIGPNRWPANPLRQLSLSISGIAFRAACQAAAFGRDVLLEAGAPLSDADPEVTFTRWLERSGWPTRGFRIVAAESPAWLRGVRNAPGRLNIEWHSSENRLNSLFDARSLCREGRFDAVLFQTADDQIAFVTLENQGREASWNEWSSPRPLAYLTLFPPSIDCGQGLYPLHEIERNPSLFRALLESAVLFSRSPNRLTLDDRVAGRLPGPEMFAAPMNGPNRCADPRDMVMLATHSLISDTSRADDPGETSPTLATAAARACSAWFGNHHPEGTDVIAVLNRCNQLLKCDPATSLRLAARHAAVGDEESAMATFIEAAALLRSSPGTPDPSALMVADLELSHGDTHLLGRVTAGAVLMSTGTEPEKLPYFCEDLLDDLADALHAAGFPNETDAERSFMLRTFEAIRAAESPGRVSTRSARGISSPRGSGTSPANGTPAAADAATSATKRRRRATKRDHSPAADAPASETASLAKRTGGSNNGRPAAARKTPRKTAASDRSKGRKAA